MEEFIIRRSALNEILKGAHQDQEMVPTEAWRGQRNKKQPKRVNIG